MKKILILICVIFSFGLNAQTKLNQIEPFKIAGVRQDSGTILTNSQGIQTYVHFDSIFKNFMIDCDKVENCLDSGAFFCEKVLECLDDGQLCEALNNFTNQTLTGNGRFVWIDSNGVCHRGLISGLPGYGFNCDSVQNCLESGILCEVLSELDTSTITIDATVLWFDDEGNCYRGNIGDITGTFNCDSVLVCLNDGLLCEAIGQFPMGVPADGDYVAVWNEDGCKLVSLDSLGGGMDSLNCEAVLECVTDSFICDIVETCLGNGLLCDELQDFPLNDATTGFTVFGALGGDCFEFNWDSATAECQVEIEVGSFGGNPEGCSWAATCDEGATHNNPFWGSLAMSGNTLQLFGNAEGQAACLMSDVSLAQLVAIDSIWITTSGCGVTLNYRKGGSNFTVGIPSMFYSVAGPVNGTYTFTPGLNNSSLCASFQICVCDVTAGCSGATVGTCGVPLMGDQEGEVFHTGSNKSIQNVYSSGIREYKSRKAAIKDCELQKGDIYIVKGSDKIRFKR